ncbi:hypothetical protein C0J52_20449 [Blattella germanica]|nr:hypothetical protein C0J52_20449 [Blattella germanica]
MLQDSRDPLVKKLFYEKLYKMQYRDAFVSQETGVEKMRSGLFAFYGDAEAYKIMSDTYEEDEKCQLKEITINPSNSLALPVRKASQFKEHVTQKILWLREAGMIKREYKRWFIQRPKCDSDSRGFVSVRIKDFYPVLVILSFGIAGSLMFFALELLHHKTVHGTFYPKAIIL